MLRKRKIRKKIIPSRGRSSLLRFASLWITTLITPPQLGLNEQGVPGHSTVRDGSADLVVDEGVEQQ